MKDTRTGDRIVFFLLGSALGAAVALLVAPESGARTRRTLRRKGEDAADYVVDAGKDLVERCEDLYKRSGELAGDAAPSSPRNIARCMNEARNWSMRPQL